MDFAGSVFMIRLRCQHLKRIVHAASRNPLVNFICTKKGEMWFYKTTLPPIRVDVELRPAWLRIQSLALAAGVWWAIEYEDVQELRWMISPYAHKQTWKPQAFRRKKFRKI